MRFELHLKVDTSTEPGMCCSGFFPESFFRLFHSLGASISEQRYGLPKEYGDFDSLAVEVYGTGDISNDGRIRIELSYDDGRVVDDGVILDAEAVIKESEKDVKYATPGAMEYPCYFTHIITIKRAMDKLVEIYAQTHWVKPETEATHETAE